MHALHFVFRNLDQYKIPFFAFLLCGVIDGVASFLIPVTLANFTKQPLTNENVTQTILIIIGLYVLTLVVAYIVRRGGEGLAFKFANHIRAKYFQKLCLLPATSLQKVHSGYTMSLVNKVSDGYTEIIFTILWQLAPGVIVATLFFVFIALESPILAVVNGIIMLTFLALSLALSKKMVPLASKLNTRRASLLESYVDFMANIITVKKLGIRDYAQGRLTAKTKLSDQQIAAVQKFHAGRWFLLHSLFGLAFILTIGFIVWQIGNNAASPALLILFVSAYATLRGLIERLSENIKALMEMKAYLFQLDKLTHDTTRQSGSVPKNWNRINFLDISFSYESGTTVKIPNFSLESHDKVAIVGKSGQGKSTFLNLLTNYLQPQAGNRTIDDRSYAKISTTFFEKHVALVAQDTELLNISIRENLTLGKDVSDTRIKQLVEELDMTSWLESLKDGLSTVVGEKATKLSAGQRQRLSILRAILLDRSLYVLDEPTSHLDEHTEQKTVAFLKRHLKNKAVVVITHRPALMDLCKNAYEMKDHTLTPLPKNHVA